MDEDSDDRSPMAVAMAWTSRVTTIAGEMVLPGLLGVWVDRQLGTGLTFLLLGVVAGFTMGMWSLVKLAKMPARDDDFRRKDQENSPKR